MRFMASVLGALLILVGVHIAAATSYVDILLYAQNQDAISQWQVALIKHAIYVKQGHTDGSVSRSATYADQVLAAPRQFAANLIAPLVIADAAAPNTITCSGSPRVCVSSLSDADIQYLVDLNWTALCCQ